MEFFLPPTSLDLKYLKLQGTDGIGNGDDEGATEKSCIFVFLCIFVLVLTFLSIPTLQPPTPYSTHPHPYKIQSNLVQLQQTGGTLQGLTSMYFSLLPSLS